MKATAAHKRGCLIGLGFSFFMLWPRGGFADSLYSPSSSFANLYSDRRAAKVGDVLYIVITEVAQASQTVANETKNSSELNMGPGRGWLDFIPLLGYKGSTAAQSSGKAARSEVFTARIAVTVVGMTPTGNLLVEGSRIVNLHHDKQIITFKGEVRPQDISADNTVPSYRVANASITYTGSDPLRPGKKVGIITRLFHWLF